MTDRKIALIGGGFSNGEFVELDDVLLNAAAKDSPRICFIPTASGDSPDYIKRFYAAFLTARAVPSHLELFRRSVDDLDAFFSEQDVIYVGGGSTANLLAVWRLHGVDPALKKAYARGVVLGGISAGAACWFDACLTDSFGPVAALNDGLGLLPGSFCPHYNSEPQREGEFRREVEAGRLPQGVALDDGAAALYINEELAVVSKAIRDADLHAVERNPL
ncbi:Type 1 glutamine amidotransferase-like domain-containing protein [Frigoribacterium salinisoli]